MKNLFYLIIASLFFLGACKKESTEPQPSMFNDGVYIVNQGTWSAGNASLSYFEPADQTLYSNVFSSVNGVPLGDVAQSITFADESAYIVVNNSGLVYAIDRWAAEVKGKIDSLGSPRHMVMVDNNKAYVSDLYNDRLAIVNPNTFEITGSVALGGWTGEEMLSTNKKVFAASWSNFGQANRNDVVLVVDEALDKLVDSIKVGLEPNSMVLDKNNHLWVLCSGGWDNVETPALYKIDPTSNQVLDTLVFPNIATSPVSLEINGAGDSLFFLNAGIYKMSIEDSQIPETAFIDEGMERSFLALGVDPVNGDIYTSDARDFLVNGIIFRFNHQGNLRQQFESGIVPGAFGFNYR